MKAREKRARRKARLARRANSLEALMEREDRRREAAAEWQAFVDDLALRNAAAQLAFAEEGP